MTPFTRPRPNPRPRVRLVALHHAGGSAAAYFPLSRGLPAEWDLLILDLPGRGKRRALEPLRDMAALVAQVVQDVRPWLDAPFALFGHSLGAILAAEVGRVLQQEGTPAAWIGVSGRVAPGFSPPRMELAALDDAALLQILRALGGIPERFSEVPEFRDLFLRVARADLEAADSYSPAPGRAPLSSPLTAFSGESDPWAQPIAMRAWAREARERPRLRLFPGGHFYFLGTAFPELARAVVEEVGLALHAVPAIVASSDPLSRAS